MPIYSPCSDASAGPCQNQGTGLPHLIALPNSTQLLWKAKLLWGAPPQLPPGFSSFSGVAFRRQALEPLQLFACITRAALDFMVRDTVYEDNFK